MIRLWVYLHQMSSVCQYNKGMLAYYTLVITSRAHLQCHLYLCFLIFNHFIVSTTFVFIILISTFITICGVSSKDMSSSFLYNDFRYSTQDFFLSVSFLTASSFLFYVLIWHLIFPVVNRKSHGPSDFKNIHSIHSSNECICLLYSHMYIILPLYTLWFIFKGCFFFFSWDFCCISWQNQSIFQQTCLFFSQW